MESGSNDKVAEISGQLIELLKDNNENHWSIILANIRGEYIASGFKPETAAQFLIIMRGGMGSFLDLALHKDRKVLVEETKKLDELRDKLYYACKKL